MLNSKNVNAIQKVFTLIELVVVIVILGILAVTAAPKFIDITSDAKASVVQAVEGSLSSAADMAHARALINGVTDGDISIAGENITFVNGYPGATSINLLMDIDAGTSENDFVLGTSTALGTTYTHSQATTEAECVATYMQTTNPDVKPVISSITTGC